MVVAVDRTTEEARATVGMEMVTAATLAAAMVIGGERSERVMVMTHEPPSGSWSCFSFTDEDEVGLCP
jgi:hypothetical protein